MYSTEAPLTACRASMVLRWVKLVCAAEMLASWEIIQSAAISPEETANKAAIKGIFRRELTKPARKEFTFEKPLVGMDDEETANKAAIKGIFRRELTKPARKEFAFEKPLVGMDDEAIFTDQPP